MVYIVSLTHWFVRNSQGSQFEKSIYLMYKYTTGNPSESLQKQIVKIEWKLATVEFLYRQFVE